MGWIVIASRRQPSHGELEKSGQLEQGNALGPGSERELEKLIPTHYGVCITTAKTLNCTSPTFVKIRSSVLSLTSLEINVL